ncbi:MAG: BadF/BadG/BcrA/BcrD ATPase family protein [Pseudomonadota bacterium]
MSSGENITVLAIDGGGTHCRFALATPDELAVVETGPANVFTNMDEAVTTIKLGLEKLAASSSFTLDELSKCPAFVGLAGLLGDGAVTFLRSELPFHNPYFVDDRPAAMRGALGHDDGIVAHCGTGSFFASQANGAYRLSGGWGAELGDEASSKWLGHMALAMTLKVHDGFLIATPMTDKILGRFGDTRGIIDFAQTATPGEIGQLAPTVTEHASHGDEAAQNIMGMGADYIAKGLHLMGWTEQMKICLTGGVAPHYTAYLPDALRATIVEPKGTPLDGAISLAREYAKGTLHECH